MLYASLRVGPWSIARRERLDRLRDIAQRETAESERRMEFAMRQWERKRPGQNVDATILNPLIDHVEVAALEALDPPEPPVATVDRPPEDDRSAPVAEEVDHGPER